MMNAAPNAPPRSRWQRLSLRTRLVLLVVASVVPLLAFSLGQQYFEYQTELRQTGRERLALARSMSAGFERELQTGIAVLQVLAGSATLRTGDMETFRTELDAVAARSFPGSSIALLRENGQQLLSTAVPHGAPVPARTDLYSVKTVFATGRPAVSALFESAAARRNAVSLDVPVRGAEGRIVYALSLVLPSEVFAEVIRRHRAPQSWIVALFDAEGTTVARSRDERLVGQKAGEQLLRALREKREGVYEGVSRDGIATLATFSRTDPFGWAVTIGTPKSELIAPALEAALRTLVIGGVLLALSLAFAVFVARRIAGPIGELRRLATSANRDVVLTAPATGLVEADDVAHALRDAEVRRRESERIVLERSAQLEAANTSLQSEIGVRRLAEQKAQAQLERLGLLHQITRAIGERQDLHSIFQVVVRSLEEQLPIDFVCLCLYDRADHALTVACVGAKSQDLALELAMPERARVDIDENGLSQCVRGRLVYEPDITELDFPFPKRLAQGGLQSLVAAPLQVESQVFGVLVAARHEKRAFSSGECEFLRQLCEHVALASHQAQLYGALQQAYDDLRQTQQAVMQQERLRALGQMASGIAHDINNALSPVALYTESLLEKEPGLSARAREYLETIQRSVEDVSHTVARMKDFYRQREPQLALMPVKVNQLIQQVIELTRARWSDMAMQRGTVIDVRTECAVDLPPVMGIESEIREALTNLILNAVDAMPNGGSLVLRTKVTQGRSDPENRYVQIEVADSGVGMDEETRRRCLEPFFTTKGERGTGLGLAMVYGVARRHGAEIDIESAPGAGTTFIMTFPAPLPAAAGPAQTMPTSAPAQRQRLRLLLVDDDPLLLKSLRDILESEGHVIVTANDGREGIDMFRSSAERGGSFNAVITDLGMPHVDGRKVAAAVKEAAPDMPVILLTGWGQRLISEDDIPVHVDCVLSKPPRLRDLREALARCCQPRQ